MSSQWNSQPTKYPTILPIIAAAAAVIRKFNPRDVGYHPPIAADAKIAPGDGDEAISSIESSDRKRRTAAQANTEGKTAALAIGKCQRSTILT
jgi:hypothetical protein